MSTPLITAPPIDDRSTGSEHRGASTDEALGKRVRTALRRLVRGREADPAWSRPLLWLVGLLAGALTLWGLTRNGYANTYYAEAAQAASRSWWAWLSNSVDTSSLVSLDKGPLPNMLMGLSGRLLGFSSFSMLLPEALCGVASVLLLHNVVRRTLGHRAALLAAWMLALTPIFVAMSRFNNPDPLLVLCEIAAAWALVRTLESGRTRHLLLCGLFIGLAFNVKMLAAYLVVPGLALTFMIAGKGSLRRRVAQLAAGGGAMLAVSFVWYGAMMLVPAAHRPFVGDTTDNSWFSLIFGANGLNRVSGGGGGGPTGAGTFGGAPSLTRLFNPIVGGQISWLLPLALLGLLLGLWARRRAPRTDPARSAYILWSGWGVVTWAIFSFSEGVFHPYYTTALAPAVAVLAAGALVELWDRAQRSIVWAAALGAAAIGTAVWTAVLLARTSGFVPWLAPTAIVLAALAGGALLLARVESVRRPHAPSLRMLLPFAAVAGLVGVLAGPASYAIATVGDTLTGSNPLAGPASANTGLSGAPGGGFGGSRPSGLGDFPPVGAASGAGGRGSASPSGGGSAGRLPTQPPSGVGQSSNGTPQAPPTGAGLPGGGPGGAAPTGAGTGGLPPAAVAGGTAGSGARTGAAGTTGGGLTGAGGRASGGGLTDASGAAGAGGANVSSTMIKYLEAHQGSAKYMVAAVGSNIAGTVALQSGRNVIDMGGFMGADPAPTLAQVEHLIDTGQLHYILLDGAGAPGGFGGGGTGSPSDGEAGGSPTAGSPSDGEAGGSPTAGSPSDGEAGGSPTAGSPSDGEAGGSPTAGSPSDGEAGGSPTAGSPSDGEAGGSPTAGSPSDGEAGGSPTAGSPSDGEAGGSPTAGSPSDGEAGGSPTAGSPSDGEAGGSPTAGGPSDGFGSNAATSRSGSRLGGSAAAGAPGGGGPGAAGTSNATVETRDRWIETHGTVVHLAGQSTSGSGAKLYYFAG